MFSASRHLLALSIALLAASFIASALPESYCHHHNSTHTHHHTHNHTHTHKHCHNGTLIHHHNGTHTHHHKSKTHSATVTTVALTSGGFGPVSYIFVGFRSAHAAGPAVTSMSANTGSLQKRQVVTNTVTVTVTSDSTVSVTITTTPSTSSSVVSTVTSMSTSATTTMTLTTTSPTATNCPTLVGSPGYNSFGIINGTFNLSQAGPACLACNLKLAKLTILDAGIVRSSSFSQVAWVNSWNGDNYGGAPLLFYPGLEIASPLASTNASALCYTGQIDELAVYFAQAGSSSSSFSSNSSSSSTSTTSSSSATTTGP